VTNTGAGSPRRTWCFARTTFPATRCSSTTLARQRLNSAAGRSVFLRAFFEAKYPELVDLARLFPDNLSIYFQKLGYLDPVHQNYYEQALAKAKQAGGG